MVSLKLGLTWNGQTKHYEGMHASYMADVRICIVNLFVTYQKKRISNALWSFHSSVARIQKWFNPFVPTVPTFAVRETASLGIMGTPRVPPSCRETQSVGQQMLNAAVGKNGLTLQQFLPYGWLVLMRRVDLFLYRCIITSVRSICICTFC